MDPQAAFAELIAALTADPDVAEGKALHAPGLKRAGKLFAMHLADAGLVLKLPAPRVLELVAEGVGAPFGTGGRVMREWTAIGADHVDAWPALAAEALAFART
jgi:hypothetical protein